VNKILVTGAAGFIGSSLVERLAGDPNNYVIGVDNFLTGSPDNLPPLKPNWRFVKCDVNNHEDILQVMSASSFDYVFHYAAVVGVQRTLEFPVKVLHDIQGIRNILDLAKNTGVKRVFFSSSSEVYGEPVEMPQNEFTTPLNSRLPYAVVKNVGEAFCKTYQQEFGLNYTIFRFFNTYGPRQSTDFVISKFLKAALRNADIIVYGDGLQTRTFMYIDDNIEASMNAFTNDVFVNDVVNIGSDDEVTVKDLAELIIKVSGSKSQLVYERPLVEGDMRRRKPDVTKLKYILPRDPLPLEAGILKLIESGKF
jgi:UDP-glucose 4-epimerase